MGSGVSEGLRGIPGGISGGKGSSFPISLYDKFGGGRLDAELASSSGNGITFFQDQSDQFHALLGNQRRTSKEMIDFRKGLGIFGLMLTKYYKNQRSILLIQLSFTISFYQIQRQSIHLVPYSLPSPTQGL